MSDMTSGQPQGSETVAMADAAMAGAVPAGAAMAGAEMAGAEMAGAEMAGAAPEAVLAPRTMIGPYMIMEVLGQGGMGCVYKAIHVNLKKTVAIKILAPNQTFPRLVERFYQEMQAIGRLEHVNLVRATDAGEVQGRHFLVMDYVEGEDLAKILRRRGKLDVNEACAVVGQAAQGLKYLAEHKLVHRDIKPSNLMITPTGQVKILDLGLALLGGEQSTEQSELTNPGQVMGTWDYMAPEQGLDSHHVDIRADIYSLGCTFFKMLTGIAPFASSSHATHQEKVRAHQEARIPKVTELRPEVPVAIERILDRMLAKAPAERFQSPQELLEALSRAEKGGPVAPASPGSATSEIRPSGFARALARAPLLRWVAGGAAFLALMIVLVAWLLYWRKEHVSNGDFRPGVWHDLMEHRPRELYWGNVAPPAWNQERKEIVAAPAGDRGLLELAVIPPGNDYRFRVAMRQGKWTGNFGVFFGFRETLQAEERTLHYQALELVGRPDGSVVIERQKVKATLPAKGGSHWQTERLVAQLLSRPPRDEEPLEIEVHGPNLIHARWGGEELEKLCQTAVNRLFKDEDYIGGIGVSCIDNMAIFRNAELMILAR